MAKRNGTEFEDIKLGRDKRPSIADQIDQLKCPDGKWIRVRLHGPVFRYAGYWVKTKTKQGKETRFYVPSPSYDPSSDTYDSTIYDPWLAYADTERDVERDDKLIQFAKYGYINAIVRAEQDRKPAKIRISKEEKASGHKVKDSDSWTANKVLRMSGGLLKKIKELQELNVVEGKKTSKTFPVTHPEFGMDIRIKYDSSKAPADQYTVAHGDRSPLTDEEKEMLTYDLTELEIADDEKEIKTSYERWAAAMKIKTSKASKKNKADEDDEEDEDLEDDEDEAPKSKKKKPAAKKSRDEDDEDDDDDEDSDDEDSDDDDDDDFGDDDDEDDEDEKPAKSKSKKPVAKSSKKSKSDDDEDDDDDFGDDDDEDSDDDEDDDFGDDDDDEDEKPKSKTKPAAKSKPSAKSKKPADDEDDDEDSDDDEDDDFDDDDDEEEEKPAKKVVKKNRRR